MTNLPAPTASELSEASDLAEIEEQKHRMGFSFELTLPEPVPLEKARNELCFHIRERLAQLTGNQLLLPWEVNRYQADDGSVFGIEVRKWFKFVMTIEPFFIPTTGQVAYRINSPIMDNHEVKFKLAQEKLGTNRVVDSVDAVLSAVRWGGHWTPVLRKSRKQKEQERKVYLAQAVQVIELRE